MSCIANDQPEILVPGEVNSFRDMAVLCCIDGIDWSGSEAAGSGCLVRGWWAGLRDGKLIANW